MRRIVKNYVVIAAIAVIAVVGCRREQSSAPPVTTNVTTATATANEPVDAGPVKVDTVIPKEIDFLERADLGTRVDKTGAVAETKTTIAPGEPVTMTMWLKESPQGLTTAAKWYDGAGKELQTDLVSMQGGKVASFTLKKRLTPGDYRVEGYWGGNIATNLRFRVEGPVAKSTQKKGKTKKN